MKTNSIGKNQSTLPLSGAAGQRDACQMTEEQIASWFGCTVDRIRLQHRKCAAAMRQMHAKAVATGRKVGGYTAGQLAASVAMHESKGGAS